MTEYKFEIGVKVVKVSGYAFPGTVIARGRTSKGELRYLVECSVPEVAGMLHVFNGDQLEAAP